jgi:hypothetical protein
MANPDNQPEKDDFALAAEEVMAAIRELHDQDGIDDVFGRLPADGAEQPT